MKTYCSEEMVGLECNEWVPADVARELFETLKLVADQQTKYYGNGSGLHMAMDSLAGDIFGAIKHACCES